MFITDLLLRIHLLFILIGKRTKCLSGHITPSKNDWNPLLIEMTKLSTKRQLTCQQPEIRLEKI
jgi:hypothetical protein